MLDNLGYKRSGPGDATNVTPALDITPLDRSRAMPAEAHIPPQGDSANANPNREILEQYLPLSALVCSNDDHEAEAHYKLNCLLERGVKPGVIFSLARFAQTTADMLGIMGELQAANYHPAEAERFATRAMAYVAEPHAKDSVWQIVMLAAAQSAMPDANWQHIHAVTSRIIKKIERGQE